MVYPALQPLIRTPQLNWCPHRFKWTCLFPREMKSGFFACAITFQTLLHHKGGGRWLCRILPILIPLLHNLPIDMLQHFNISLHLLINIIISGLNNTAKVMPLPWYYKFTFYISVISPDDGWNCRPKYFAYIRNKWMLEHVCNCIGLIITEDIYWIHTTG
jgi:hypothetical protein